MNTGATDRGTATTRRARLAECIAKLAVALESGEVEMGHPELHELAALCDAHFLYAEAARVRRWMAP